MTGVTSNDTFGPGPNAKRRRRREPQEEDDSSDLSDESEEDTEGAQRYVSPGKACVEICWLTRHW